MLKKQWKMLRAGKQGFTLIELLVVVLIIGVLASVAIPQYFKVVERSRVAEAYTTISAFKSAEEHYLAKQGVYSFLNEGGSLLADLVGGSCSLNHLLNRTYQSSGQTLYRLMRSSDLDHVLP